MQSQLRVLSAVLALRSSLPFVANMSYRTVWVFVLFLCVSFKKKIPKHKRKSKTDEEKRH